MHAPVAPSKSMDVLADIGLRVLGIMSVEIVVVVSEKCAEGIGVCCWTSSSLPSSFYMPQGLLDLRGLTMVKSMYKLGAAAGTPAGGRD